MVARHRLAAILRDGGLRALLRMRSEAMHLHFAPSTKPSISGSVKDRHDLHRLLLNAMDYNVRQTGDRQQPDPARTWPTRIRKARQAFGASLDSSDNAPRSLRIVSCNVGPDGLQIPQRR